MENLFNFQIVITMLTAVFAIGGIIISSFGELSFIAAFYVLASLSILNAISLLYAIYKAKNNGE